MRKSFFISSFFLLLSLLVALPCFADAIMLTKAMEASTISEVFIEEKSVRVELEVGMEDVSGLINLLPDGL